MSSPSVRVVQDRLVNADGSSAIGTMQISWSAGLSPDGFAIAAGKLTLHLNNGGFSVSLAPGAYKVKYILARGAQRTESWIVPSDPGPFRINQVKQ